MGIRDRIRSLSHAWNAFEEKEDQLQSGEVYNWGVSSYGARPDRGRMSISNDRSIVSSTIMRVGIDAAAIDLLHVRVDENGYYTETIDSGLNYCLTVEANIDQAARAFRQDVVMSMLDQGVIAIVPVDTSLSPTETGGYDIKTLRVGEIVTWYDEKVTVRVWNTKKQLKEEVTLPKKMVAIVENPLYSVMNEANSTLQRLIRKLILLDAIDEQSGSGKLDLIIQLPYVIKSEARKQQAQQRQESISSQLRNSQYGIAYTDATEKITQLNRPSENNLMAQIEYLTDMLYGQLGITKEVMEGTADDKTMLNYHNRTIDPILAAISEAIKRTFLTKTARAQKQSVVYIRNPFRTVAIGDLAELADKLTRNEIMSSNEMRAVIGMRPSKDPKADELRNKNLPEQPDPSAAPELGAAPVPQQLDPPPERLAIEAAPGSRVRQIMEGQ